MTQHSLRIGILSVAHMHADSYVSNLRAVPGVELIGFSDVDAERGRSFAGQHGVRHYLAHEELLALQPDAVVVCSENTRHRGLVEMASRAGCHVLCEKPLATTRDDAEAMIAACRAAGVILMIAFPMRFSAPLRNIKERLEAGDLGKVYCLSTTNQGRMPIAARRWFVEPDLAGGGAMMDHIVHLADIFNWFFGRKVTSVYAQSNHILHADTVDVETGGLVMLTYEGGLFATIDCSWSKPLNYPTWGGLTMELISERGLAVVDGFSQNLNIYHQDPPTNAWAYWGSDANQAMIEEFVAAIRDGREPLVTGEDGAFALAITLAAYESAAGGQPVTPLL
jgi:predicted dehydrogenase